MAKITPIHYKKLVKILELDGAQQVGQEGSHIVLVKRGLKRRLVVPAYKEIPVFIVKNNLKTAQISRERYFELLKKVS